MPFLSNDSQERGTTPARQFPTSLWASVSTARPITCRPSRPTHRHWHSQRPPTPSQLHVKAPSWGFSLAPSPPPSSHLICTVPNITQCATQKLLGRLNCFVDAHFLSPNVLRVSGKELLCIQHTYLSTKCLENT